MRKITTLVSILTCSSLLISSYNCYPVSADTEALRPKHTYFELIEMSDEEIIEEYGKYIDYYIELGFGNNELSEEEKFKNMWPDVWSGIEYYENEHYTYYRMFVTGELEPYFHLRVSDDILLDSTLTPHDLGFPSEWEMELYRGVIYGDETEQGGWWYHYGHDYEIHIPKEVFDDFETYIRLIMAGSVFSSTNNDFSIEYFSNPVELLDPLGAQPEAVVLGDVNDTDTVDISDATAIMAYATNPEAYPLSDLQLLLGDIYQQGDGIGIIDAVSIQKYLTKQIDSLPESVM